MKAMLLKFLLAIVLVAVGAFVVGFVAGSIKGDFPLVVEHGVYGRVINELAVNGKEVWL